jgi:shikimate kinase
VQSGRAIRNLVLIGFMGSGKTSIGRLVAARLGFDFVDTDAWIEARTGRSVTRLFEEEGEAVFRRHEREAVAAVALMVRTVIATGGGLPVDPANLASLREHALLICLWAGPETIWERVRRQVHRPLLRTADPQARIRELLAEREPFYRQADVLVNTQSRSIQQVAQYVATQFLSVYEDQQS